MASAERKLILFLGDVVAAIIALLVVLQWRFVLGSLSAPSSTVLRWCALLALMWGLIAPTLAVYDLRAAVRMPSAISLGLRASSIVTVAYLLVPKLTPYLLPSRLSTISLILLTACTVTAWRVIFAGVMRRFASRRRVLLLGAGEATERAAKAFRQHDHEYEIVAYLDFGDMSEAEPNASPEEIGRLETLSNVLADKDLELVVVETSDSFRLDEDALRLILQANERGVDIVAASEAYESLTGRVPIPRFAPEEGVLELLMPLSRTPQRILMRAAKRLIDIAGGVLLLLLAAIFVPFVFVANLFVNRGPLFYRQARLGRGGKPFRLAKFRTMVASAESSGPRWSGPDDSRVTPMGKLLRHLHLDELPQGWNLILGHMSLVGPRPEQPSLAEWLSSQTPYHNARLAITPGLTGWAQVHHSYVSTPEDAEVRLEYDLYYAKHLSVGLDLRIMALTVSQFLGFRSRYWRGDPIRAPKGQVPIGR